MRKKEEKKLKEREFLERISGEKSIFHFLFLSQSLFNIKAGSAKIADVTLITELIQRVNFKKFQLLFRLISILLLNAILVLKN